MSAPSDDRGAPPGDLARLRIDRDSRPPRRWLPWVVPVVLLGASFSEVAFTFRVAPALVASGLLFAVLMGAVGSLLPAIRAARIPVARALREI